MNLKDVVEFIISDPSVGTPNGFEAVVTAIKERQKINKSVLKATALSTFRIGTLVRLSGLSPKYWNGTEGVITDFNQTRTRVSIRVTKSLDPRVAVGKVQKGFPITTLTLVNSAPTTSFTQEDSNELLDFLGG